MRPMGAIMLLWLFECPAGVHAFQWYETFGEIEYKARLENGVKVKPPNEIVASYHGFQGAIEAWERVQAA